MELIFAFGIGFVAGLRAVLPAALLGFARRAHVWAWALAVLAVVELIGDIIPSDRSRLAPLPLLARVIAGAACAQVLVGGVTAVALGIAGALAGAYAGAAWRGFFAKRRLPDWPFALIEDAAAVALGWLLVVSYIPHSFGRT